MDVFQAVREGVYVGTLGAASTTTRSANPHLKMIFGYPLETAESLVQPFDLSRFVDPQARTLFIDPTERHKEAYKLLLKVYLACTQVCVCSLSTFSEMQLCK